MAVQVVAEGIPCAVLSIPCATCIPVETVSLKDVRRAGRLMVEFIAGLMQIPLTKIKWED